MPTYGVSTSRDRDLHPIAVAIIGASQSGKSTILGQLMKFRCGEKFLNEYLVAKGYDCRHICDYTDEERASGHTMGIRTTYQKYSVGYDGLEKWLIAFLDCPGHPDHFEKAITGMSQADSALIVVDASEGVFEESIKKGSHLWKLVFAASTLGVKLSNFYCVVNKLDKVGNSETRYNEVVAAMTTFLKPFGIKPIEYISMVANVGSTSYNVYPDGMKDLSFRLIAGLKDYSYTKQYKHTERPLRLCIHEERDSSNSGGAKEYVFRGRVDSGTLKTGMTLQVGNTGATGAVGVVERMYDSCTENRRVNNHAGELAAAEIVAIEVGHWTNPVTDIQPGDVIGDANNDPPKPAERFTVQVTALGDLKKGSTVTVDIGTAHALCRIDTIPKLMTKKGELLGEDVSDVSEGQACIAVLVPDPNARPVCVDKFAEVPYLGRFLVRDGVTLLGFGIVKDVVERA